MKNYYLMNLSVLTQKQDDNAGHRNLDLFSGACHWIHIDSDNPDSILVCGTFNDEWHELKFSRLDGVETLPHLALEGNKALDPVKHLKHLSKTPLLGMKDGDTMLDLVRRLPTLHTLMGVSGLR